MRRILTAMLMVAATTLVVAAGPEDGVKEAGAGWRQGAIKQDKALLEKYLATIWLHARRRSSESKAQYMPTSERTSPYWTGPSETRVRIYGKTAVLLGLGTHALQKARPIARGR